MCGVISLFLGTDRVCFHHTINPPRIYLLQFKRQLAISLFFEALCNSRIRFWLFLYRITLAAATRRQRQRHLRLFNVKPFSLFQLLIFDIYKLLLFLFFNHIIVIIIMTVQLILLSSVLVTELVTNQISTLWPSFSSYPLIFIYNLHSCLNLSTLFSCIFILFYFDNHLHHHCLFY